MKAMMKAIRMFLIAKYIAVYRMMAYLKNEGSNKCPNCKSRNFWV